MATATQTRWVLDIDKTIDKDLRDYLQESSERNPDAFARFVEEAVNSRLLDLRVAKMRGAFADMSPEEISKLVDEAVTWARSPEGRECE